MYEGQPPLSQDACSKPQCDSKGIVKTNPKCMHNSSVREPVVRKWKRRLSEMLHSQDNEKGKRMNRARDCKAQHNTRTYCPREVQSARLHTSSLCKKPPFSLTHMYCEKTMKPIETLQTEHPQRAPANSSLLCTTVFFLFSLLLHLDLYMYRFRKG